MGCECEGIQGLHLIGAENRLDLLVIPVKNMDVTNIHSDKEKKRKKIKHY